MEGAAVGDSNEAWAAFRPEVGYLGQDGAVCVRHY